MLVLANSSAVLPAYSAASLCLKSLTQLITFRGSSLETVEPMIPLLEVTEYIQ